LTQNPALSALCLTGQLGFEQVSKSYRFALFVHLIDSWHKQPSLLPILQKSFITIFELNRCTSDKAVNSRINTAQRAIRKTYPEGPPRIEYNLSDKGESLKQIIDLLSVWSRENLLVDPVA
jgi:hypothetical protein